MTIIILTNDIVQVCTFVCNVCLSVAGMILRAVNCHSGLGIIQIGGREVVVHVVMHYQKRGRGLAIVIARWYEWVKTWICLKMNGWDGGEIWYNGHCLDRSILKMLWIVLWIWGPRYFMKTCELRPRSLCLPKPHIWYRPNGCSLKRLCL